MRDRGIASGPEFLKSLSIRPGEARNSDARFANQDHK